MKSGSGGSTEALQLEPSVLVGKAAGVGFVDGVQEVAVGLHKQQKNKIKHIVMKSEVPTVDWKYRKRRGGAPPGSGSAAWFGAGFWKELGSRPAAAAVVVVGLGSSGRGYSPAGIPARRSWTWPE